MLQRVQVTRLQVQATSGENSRVYSEENRTLVELNF